MNLPPYLRSIITPAIISGVKTPSPPQINQKIMDSNPVTSERNGMYKWVITPKSMAADTNISVDGINLNGFICILLLIIYKISYFQSTECSAKNNPFRFKSNFFIWRIIQVSSKGTIIKNGNINHRKEKLPIKI